VKVPYEYFIKYLISCRQDTTEINRTLETHGLLPITDEYVSKLRIAMSQPNSFRASHGHEVSMRWLIRQQIRALWFRHEFPEVLEAFDMLGRPNIRKIVDAMTLLPINQLQISEALRRHYDYKTSPLAVRTYALYFNNFLIMAPDERREYLMARKEPWKLAVLDGDVGLMKLHLGWSAAITTKEMLETIKSIAYRKIADIGQMNASESAGMAFGSYLEGVKWTTEELKQYEAGGSKIFDLLKMRHDETGQEVYQEELPSGHMASLPSGEGSGDTPEEVTVPDEQR
jgi:hypothetical protein